MPNHVLKIDRNHLADPSPYVLLRVLSNLLGPLIILGLVKATGPIDIHMILFFISAFVASMIGQVILRFISFSVATLDQEGIEFKDTFWWTFYIPVKRKIRWSDVSGLSHFWSGMTKSAAGLKTLKLTGTDEKTGAKVSYYHSVLNPKYEEFLVFVLEKIPTWKVDQSITDAMSSKDAKPQLKRVKQVQKYYVWYLLIALAAIVSLQHFFPGPEGQWLRMAGTFLFAMGFGLMFCYARGRKDDEKIDKD